jgi:hypothetical protein
MFTDALLPLTLAKLMALPEFFYSLLITPNGASMINFFRAGAVRGRPV